MYERLTPETEEQWKDLRKEVITATEVSVLLGLNKWKSVKQLMEDKTHTVILDNAYIWMGQILEPVVVQAVNKVLGTEFKLFEGRQFFVKREMGLGATPDAHDDTRLLECKSTKPANFYRWSMWPPAYYLMQLYVQLYCMDKDEGLLAVLSTNLEQKSEVLAIPVHIHKLNRNKKVDEMLETELKRFWDACKAGKIYRVNRKQVNQLEMLLRFNTRTIV